MANTNGTPGKPLAKTKTCHERQMKVGSAFSSYRPKGANPYHTSPPVPWIRLQGQWLDIAGFAVGTPLKVRVMERCLVITVGE
jgi:hypothetical protein